MVTDASIARPVVVVGVDGSQHSLDALRWAAGYVRDVGGLLRPIVAWSFSASTAYVIKPDFEKDAKDDLEETLKVLRSEFGDVAIDPRVVEGSPAAVLIDASRDADLLVVGTRGRGGFTEMLLGSVSEHCVHHAACAVAVVRSGAS